MTDSKPIEHHLFLGRRPQEDKAADVRTVGEEESAESLDAQSVSSASGSEHQDTQSQAGSGEIAPAPRQPETTSAEEKQFTPNKSWIGKKIQLLTAGFKVRWGELRSENQSLRGRSKKDRKSISKEHLNSLKDRTTLKKAIILTSV